MKKSNEMRERILKAVEDLITTRGVNNFSLRDIADYLEISTGSLYYHFKTKDEIILAIVDKHFDVLESDYVDWLERHKSKNDLTKERFIDIILYKGTELFNRSKIHIYLINECMRNDVLKEKYEMLLSSWYKKLVQGVKQVYGERDDADALAYILLLMVEGTTIRVVLDDRNKEQEDKMKKILKEM